ncbi:hypothetical protein NEUTE1DRAFT_48460 [Neurospora tetrasperma FGSC 2508]|uniref:UspA domain-containing protein n=1 Tax=Neurospora tetrasperma (strain FGSC 2508 / ATCC MYA-4615 / P0657) TaxID=510951 RepID=F8MWI2_NEUT8|nr:uncharacterized protein NEUTE1DRAFT_48460 [Neurospora tetrasperma FGSC 2508]EGO54124.1 hypothetical protein NEUTE1DRAFT_48460 [Neurospora tetrasperma FGSC 2508]
MSMEAMLDEERKEVLALLEGPNGQGSRSRAGSMFEDRSPSPFTTPRTSVRSMLDIGDDHLSAGSPLPPPISPVLSHAKTASSYLAPVRSMLDIAPGPAKPVRSMLDIPAATSSRTPLSNPNSPIEPKSYKGPHPRSLSDAGIKPVEFGPRASARSNPMNSYQFGDIITNPNHTGQALPKRVTQGGKRQSSSMVEVMKSNDVSNLVLPSERGRHTSLPGPGVSAARPSNKSKSKSPHGRSGMRSKSPHELLAERQLSPAGRALLDEALDYKMNTAYRHLSDAALVRSGGNLAEVTLRKKSDDAPGSGRLVKDYMGPDGEPLVEDSSEDNESSSEGELDRGRKAARNTTETKAKQAPELAQGNRQVKSLLAAAEEERIQVEKQQPQYTYRSLLDEPAITVTGPSGRTRKPGVHPATSFDLPSSGSRTPMDSDTEADLTDIKRAQKLSFAVTQIISQPEVHRTIQIITRGDYSQLVQETQDEHNQPRKYLVATDLSEESTHALEWAIGTVLRDGDTLIAIYCVDEETGILGADGNSLAASMVPDDPKAMRETATALDRMANSKSAIQNGGGAGSLSPLAATSMEASGMLSTGNSSSAIGEDPSPTPSHSSRERSRAEEERYRAVQEISDRVTKLLRKTRLQVRVIVEVLHCKNPKHLITEVIDHVNPTLVILGSRGRSALKGVILGSFSNYLVTKSSVPVMVARKRLRKQSKYKRLPATHQVNNINNPTARSLASAKID